MITVEVRDLRVFGRHGVHDEERERGQDFLFDVELEVGERGTSDRIEDAGDYGEVDDPFFFDIPAFSMIYSKFCCSKSYSRMLLCLLFRF